MLPSFSPPASTPYDHSTSMNRIRALELTLSGLNDKHKHSIELLHDEIRALQMKYAGLQLECMRPSDVTDQASQTEPSIEPSPSYWSTLFQKPPSMADAFWPSAPAKHGFKKIVRVGIRLPPLRTRVFPKP